MAVEKDWKGLGLPAIILFIYAFVWFGSLVYGFSRIPFGAPITEEEYIFAGLVVVSWIAIGFLMQIIWKLVKFCHEHSQLSRFDQSRNYLLVLMGSCIFFGCVPRVVVFFDCGWIMWYSSYVCLFGIVIIFVHYLNLIDSVCKINRSWSDGRSWFLFIAQLILLIPLFSYLEKDDHPNHQRATAILLCNLAFSFVCAVASIEFYYVWRGEIKMNLNPNKEQQLMAFIELGWIPITPDQAPSEELESKFKCDVCNKNYNQTTKSPRILKECGHTVCEECGDELLKKNTEQCLNCPYCEKTTLVNGPAALLPKNSVIMDTMGLKNFKNPVEIV